MTSVHDRAAADAVGDLDAFRRLFYDCLTARADALFDLADAVLCADGPVRSLVELSLVGEHRRGHGALNDALACGRLDIDRLRVALAGVPLPRAADGRLVLAVDITCWLRLDAHTSPQRIAPGGFPRRCSRAAVTGQNRHHELTGRSQRASASWTSSSAAVRAAVGHRVSGDFRSHRYDHGRPGE